jgi:hypothetical protein
MKNSTSFYIDPQIVANWGNPAKRSETEGPGLNNILGPVLLVNLLLWCGAFYLIKLFT